MDLFLSYAERGRTRWWRYLLTIVAGLLVAILALALISMGLAALHLLPRDLAQQIQSPSDPWTFFAAIAVVFAAMGGGLAVAAALIQRKGPGDIIGAWRWRLFLYGLLVWLLVQAILAALDFALAPSGFSFSGQATPALALWTFGAILVQTFTEEFIFRGFVTQGIALVLRRPLAAACVSGLVFGAMHIPNGWPQAINALWFGMVSAFIAIRTGGIALTSGIHLANNYFGAVAVVSSGDVFKGSPGLLIQNTPQLQWWDLGVAVLALAILPWLLRKLCLLPDATGAKNPL
ncbi:MAG TPA: CPBP family intramembrane glutamic endopeptidase [Rhizomicrobium sp.]|jgi:membrane protease YdiL (CAAX protease family)